MASGSSCDVRKRSNSTTNLPFLLQLIAEVWLIVMRALSERESRFCGIYEQNNKKMELKSSDSPSIFVSVLVYCYIFARFHFDSLEMRAQMSWAGAWLPPSWKFTLLTSQREIFLILQKPIIRIFQEICISRLPDDVKMAFKFQNQKKAFLAERWRHQDCLEPPDCVKATHNVIKATTNYNWLLASPILRQKLVTSPPQQRPDHPGANLISFLD